MRKSESIAIADERSLTSQRSFTPPNALVNIANHTFIMLDAVSLIEEDYRRYAAEVQLGEWEGVPGGVIEFIKNLSESEYPRRVFSCQRLIPFQIRLLDPRSSSAIYPSRDRNHRAVDR
jgi:hypothetical protein